MTDAQMPFPFIVGCGRSGTTLLRAMCDSHPDLAIPPESHFIPAFARSRERFVSARGFDAERFLEELSGNERFARWGLPDALLKESLLGGAAPNDVADALRRVYAAYARLHGKPCVGDKTPDYVEHLTTIAPLFSEARFVHLMRDGRDVALSYADVAFGPSELVEAATLWGRRVSRGRTDGSALGPDRYLEVRYEDLVADPERVLRRDLCPFLELPFDDAMLRYHERADAILAGVLAPAHHQHLELPPTAGLRDWRTQMSGEDVAAVERAVGGVLEDLGYERMFPGPSIRRIQAVGVSKNPTIAFPFIVGSPRSGTTLLRLMLGSHSDLSIPEEAQFLVPMASHRRRYEGGSFDTQRFVRDLDARKEFRRWGIPAEDVHSLLRTLAPRDLAEAMRGVYALQAERQGKARYGDKTPRNVFSMRALLDLFPESRFVHLIRDGRDVAMSLVDMRWFSGDLAAAALRWKRSVVAGRAEGAILGDERYLEVRYEDLLAEPEQAIEGICRFLSLSFEPDMVRYRGDFANAKGSQQHQHLALPPTKGLRDWRRDMAPGDLALVEASIGDLLDELHYERGTDQIPLGVRSRARVREIREGTRVMVRRLGTSEVVG